MHLICIYATPQLLEKASDMSDPCRAPDMPPRPTFGLWDAIFFLDEPSMPLSKADEVIFGHWDDYADQAIGTLHQMIKQTEDLVFPNDEYTDLVWTFSQAFPHRPNLLTILRDNVYDKHKSGVNPMVNLPQTPVQKAWHLWATKVDVIHRDFAQKMSCCKLQFGKQDEADFGMAHLSISTNLPKTDSLTNLLHKVLDSASEPDAFAEEPENSKTGLEAHMHSLGFEDKTCPL